MERLVGARSLGGLLRRQVLWLGWLFITVVFVAELRGAVSRADGQIDALAAPVAVRELAVQVFGIGGIGVSQPVPAFPEPVDVGVMEIEHRVAADRGEFGHVAPECEMSEEVGVLIEPRIEPKAAVRRVDVELLVEGVQTDPVTVEVVDPFAPIDPEPARSVEQRGARLTEHGGDDEIVGISRHRVPVRKREILVVQHLTNDALELIEHQSVPRQEEPLLVLLRVRRVVGVRLAAVPNGLGVGSILLRQGSDDLRLLLDRQVPQGGREALDPVRVPPVVPGMLVVVRARSS